MKKVLFIMALAAGCVGAFAQGKVSFGNDANHLFVLDASDRLKPADVALAGLGIPASPLPSGITLTAGLWGGLTAGNMTLQKQVDLTGAGWLATGRMANTSTTLTFAGGSMSSFQVYIWDKAFATPAAAMNGGSYYGTSGLFEAKPGTSISYPGIVPGTPATSTWANGPVVIGIVPEPASAAILGLGMASLLIFRRRK